MALVFWTSLIPSGHILATTWNVPGDALTIQAGIEAAALGDTVLVACGTYLEYDLVMKAGVVLRGESDDAACVIIDAQGQGRILDCVDLAELTRVENITFTGGYVVDGWFDALGGGVRCLTSDLAITNCVFEGNSSRIGAGFGASESTLELNDCLFNSNSATHGQWAAGGGIWARDCSGTINNCEATANTAFADNDADPGDGGGFFFNNNHLNVNNCLFQGNSTAAGAGGFYSVANDSSILTGCDFVANIAGNGGAVFFDEGAAAQLINCTFTDNVAGGGGAIVSLIESHLTVIDCFFEGNQATQWGGGAVDVWTSQVTISGTTFLNNQAVNAGGGVNLGGSTGEISNCIFDSNTVVEKGGAIRCHYASVSIIGCTLVSNSAALGGGVYCGVESYATVEKCIIAYSTLGESMVGVEEGFATISCSDFFGNVGGDWVGDFADQLLLDGNFSADPMFCNLSQGILTLDTSSPCAAEHSGGCDLVGAEGTDCGFSAAVENFQLPKGITAVENFPNPFNPATTIRFSLSEEGPTRVVIFDMAGHQVRTLVNGYFSAQTHEVRWQGRDDQGLEVAAGMYFYQITSGNFQRSGRMALVK